MEIIMQTIRIIDYENNKIYSRETPATFEEYVRQLIGFINANNSIQELKTNSSNTAVISNILDIINNQDTLDEEYISSRIDLIAERLLEKERIAQTHVSHMHTNVQKGSLIQALLYEVDNDSYVYLLAKVEHIDFVDDSDYSFKSGFSKDKKTLWKSCIFDISDTSANDFYAKIYSNTSAKYWYDDFLELNQVVSDELNTERAFKALESTLNRNLKRAAPRDHALLSNTLAYYFKTNERIDYDLMLENTLTNYHPVQLPQDKYESLVEKLKELPSKYKFERQFNSVPDKINIRIKKVYEVYKGIQLRITDAYDNLDETIKSYRASDGKQYIQIKTDNEEVFERFLRR